jgi:exocyst complex component 4
MVASVRKERLDSQFSFEALLAMLNFQCGVDGTAGEKGKAGATDRNYSMYLIDLHGLHLAE